MSSANLNKTESNAPTSSADLNETEVNVADGNADLNETEANAPASNADLNKMEVNALTSVRSAVRDLNSVLVSGVGSAYNTTSNEERVPPNVVSFVSEKMKDMGNLALEKAMQTLPVGHNAPIPMKEAWNRLQDIESHLVESSVKAARQFAQRAMQGDKEMRRRIMLAVFNKKNMKKKTRERKQSATINFDFADLKRLVSELDWEKSEPSESLDTLMEIFGGGAKLAPFVLSEASRWDRYTSPGAKEFLTLMRMKWIKDKESPNMVFHKLGLHDELVDKKKSLTDRTRGAMEEYILDFNEKFPDRKTDFVTVLRESLGDDKCVQVILKKNAMSYKRADVDIQSFVRQLRDKGQTAEDIVDRILVNVDFHVYLLDPLLAAFGGEAEFAPLLSIAKKSPQSWQNAENMQKAMIARWMESKVQIDGVFKRLGLSNLRSMGLTYENLDVLAQYILQCNSEGHANIDVFTYLRGKFGDGELAMITLMKTKLPSGVTEHFIKQKIGKGKSSAAFCQDILEMADDMKNLLDPLLIVFGGAAKLAPLLFYARMNPNIASKAEQLQKSMLTWWLDRRIPVDKVFEWLGLSNLRSTGFTYVNLGVLAQYILQCNSEGHANIDVFTYLRGKFGDGELAMITLMKTKLPSGVTEHFIKQKIGKDKSSAAFCQDILEMADDMKNLLDPLLIVFGGAAKLAPLLFYARMNPNIASKAEQLQKSMLTWWLDRRIPVDKVFEWLGLSNLRSTGFTYVNLDVLAQYILQRNSEGHANIDVFTYLRGKFGDGELAMITLMKTKLPSGVTEHFIKQKIGKDKSSAAFCQDILEMADDMKNLLDPLLIVFGGAAKLAPLLFYARMNPNIASKAEQLQKSMLTWWLDRRIPVDKVFEWLGLSNLRSTGFTYVNLDVLAQYILQRNSEGHANIDVFTYLRGKFGDGELAMITLMKTKLPSGVTEHFIKQKIGKDKSSAAFCQDILEMADDMKNLLDPLLIVFGGAAKLAPLLFYARMNPNIASKAEQLQKSMLTWWLDRRIPVDKVFEWLGLSNLRSTGFTYENLVALDQYFVAYYVEYPLGKMDLLTYLRNNVGDGQLTLMVLKWEGVSEFAKNVGSDLVVRWRNETPKILPTDFLTKDMGEHEILAVEQYYRSAMAHNLLH